jgi:hypothetical protein
LKNGRYVARVNHIIWGSYDPAAQVSLHGQAEAVEPLSVGGVAAEPGGQVVARPVHWSGPRTRDGCFTGSALVPACWQSSSGSRAARTALSCSNAPHSQRVRRLASLWHGSTGNRCPQSRATSARKPDSLRRPSRCRTSVIASSSASVQAGADPGRRGILIAPSEDQVMNQRVDVDEQLFSWQHERTAAADKGLRQSLVFRRGRPRSSRHAGINPHNSPQAPQSRSLRAEVPAGEVGLLRLGEGVQLGAEGGEDQAGGLGVDV